MDRPATAPWPRNLPRPLSSFVGREWEIVEVQRLLRTTRLLTLTGAGGVGKTRLGQQVAVAQAAALQGEVWVVELAALADPELVPQAVASALGIHDLARQPLMATLANALQERRLLLVLDNCEHLIDACATLADTLLRACAELKILATSRQALGIWGETTYLVPSLSLSEPPAGPRALPPSMTRATTVVEDLPALPTNGSTLVEVSEAVSLFAERARAVVSTFDLTERNLPAVEQICRRLDGIPLAIELAAARVAVLTPEQIADRLDDRFTLLTDGSRTAPPRQQTLRATLDWSYDQLDAGEQALLRRLAIFAGGWTLEAAEAVCTDDDLAPDRLLDTLSKLVSKSLVTTDDHADEVRYGLLESLRAYATEKLIAAGEESVLRDRHCAWLVDLAERAEPHLNGPSGIRWLNRLEQERENIWAAIGWCLVRGRAPPGLRLAGALTTFWLVRGPYQVTRWMLAELLSLPSALSGAEAVQAARNSVLLAAGRLAMRQDDRAAAAELFNESLALSRRRGDRRSAAIARFSIGHLARVRGEYHLARRHHRKALDDFEALGDDHWLANTHHDLGLAAYFEGDLATARAHYEVTLVLSRGSGDEHGVASALNDLGEVAFLSGQLDEAEMLERACLATAREIDDKKLIAMTLAALAGIAAAQGRAVRAVRLAAAATALNEETGQRHAPAWHTLLERWLEPAHDALSPEARAEEEIVGRSMPLEEVIADVLAPGTPVPAASASDALVPDALTRRVLTPAALASDALTADIPTSDGPSQSRSDASRLVGGLSQRELEVAVLVARGLTNPQIATELIIAPGTATNHVKHILTRLGLTSRVQIAAWVVERGLHTPTPT